MKIPNDLTGDDLAQHIMSEIVIRQANKTRKLGYEKFKDSARIVNVTLNKPGTRSSEEPYEERFARMTKSEQIAEFRKLAGKAAGLDVKALEEFLDELGEEDDVQV